MTSEVERLSTFDVGVDVAAMIQTDVPGGVSYSAEPQLNSIIVTAQADDGATRRFELAVRELPPPGRVDPVGPIVDRVMQRRPPDEFDYEKVPDVLNRIGRALGIALDYQHYRGENLTAAQKDGVIDAMARALLGDEYDTFVDLARDGFSGWQTGVLPVPPDQSGDEHLRAYCAQMLQAMRLTTVAGVRVIEWDLTSVAPDTDLSLMFTAHNARTAAACLLHKADDADAYDYTERQES